MISGPAVWQVVENGAQVLHDLVTYKQANELAEFELMKNPNRSISTRLREEPPAPVAATPTSAPAIVRAAALPKIEPGKERDALYEAILELLDTTARLASAREATERARTFLDAAQTELDSAIAGRRDQINASGSDLAEAFRTGRDAIEPRQADRTPLIEAGSRRDAAQVALQQLEAELANANAAYLAAESRQQLAVLAVMRTDVAALADRLQTVQNEVWRIRAAIDVVRIYQIGLSAETQAVLQNNPPVDAGQDAAGKRWAKYRAALMEDPTATLEQI
jgi:hypothetical protein